MEVGLRLFPFSFDGFLLNDHVEIDSWFVDPFSYSLSSSSVGLIKRSGAFPAFGSVQFSEKTSSIKVNLRNPLSYRNTFTQRVNTADMVRRTLKELVVFDEDNGIFMYANCYPVSVICDDTFGFQWTVTFTIPDPEWKTVKINSARKIVTATGQTLVVTNNGNIPCEPTFTITPSLQKSVGYIYRQYYTIFSNFDSGEATNYPVDITDGGLNTAALVAAGKMLPTGNDLRVFINNIEVDRWFPSTGGDTNVINSATTKIWVNMDFHGYTSLTLLTAIAVVTPITKIYTNAPYTTINKKKIYLLEGYPSAGIIQIDNEQFYYSGIDVSHGIFTITERGSRGTTAAIHAANAVIKIITNDIKIIYGNPAATAPLVDDTCKPLLNLDDSTNTSWVFEHFGTDSNPNRSARWYYSVNTNNEDSGVHYGVANTDVDPFDVMGCHITCYTKYNRWYSGSVTLYWTFHHPAGITVVDSSGFNYRYGASWVITCKLQKCKYSLPGVVAYEKWADQYSILTPAATGAWLAWSKPAEALTGSYKYIRYAFAGSIASQSGNWVGFEVRQVTLTLDNTKTPTITRSTEYASTYTVSFRIQNDATYENTAISEWIEVNMPMMLGQTLVIETDSRSLYLYGNNISSLSALSKSSERLMWLPLYSGVNTLTFTEIGLVNITVNVAYEEKYN